MDIWLVIGMVIGILIICVGIGIICAGLADDDIESVRFGSILLLLGGPAGFLWPVVLGGALAYGLGYGLISSVKAIKHRGLDY